jgi:hypothetical protein
LKQALSKHEESMKEARKQQRKNQQYACNFIVNIQKMAVFFSQIR